MLLTCSVRWILWLKKKKKTQNIQIWIYRPWKQVGISRSQGRLNSHWRGPGITWRVLQMSSERCYQCHKYPNHQMTSSGSRCTHRVQKSSKSVSFLHVQKLQRGKCCKNVAKKKNTSRNSGLGFSPFSFDVYSDHTKQTSLSWTLRSY